MNDIKTRLIEFERENKLVPKAVGVCTALAMTAVPAFAEGESAVKTVTDSMKTELTTLAGDVATACAGVVGVALTIFGIKWAIKSVKSFFSKIAG